MTVALFCSNTDVPAVWRAALLKQLPDIDWRFWPDYGDRAAIDYALVWKPPQNVFAGCDHLKVIFSLGAGLDHLLKTGVQLPAGVPIVRMVDEALTEGMIEYALYMSLRMHRQMYAYDVQQQQQLWRVRLPQLRPAERCIGILGAGQLGGAIAQALLALGFQVRTWSRSAKQLAGVENFVGNEALSDFLSASQILINVLPLTASTHGLLNAERLHCLPTGAALINMGRGDTLIETDLLAALDDGHLAHAALDVFSVEPLPVQHPFWTHPNITLTPHIASITNPQSAVFNIAENIRRHQAGERLLNQVDLLAGY